MITQAVLRALRKSRQEAQSQQEFADDYTKKLNQADQDRVAHLRTRVAATLDTDTVPVDDDADDEILISDTDFAPPSSALPLGRINPSSPLKIAWDLWMCCCIIYSVTVVPFRISFSSDADGDAAVWEIILDVCFGIDIILTFFVAIPLPEDGGFITDLKQLALSYCKSWLVIDVLSTLPFAAIATAITDSEAHSGIAGLKVLRVLRIMRLFKLVRLFKMSKILGSVSSVTQAVNVKPAFFSLAKFFFGLLLYAHLIACLFFFIGVDDAEEAGSWLVVQDLLDESPFVQYVSSFYWTITTMSTVGYGDIVGGTLGQRIFSVFVQLSGVSAFGFVVGNVSSILESMDSSSAIYAQRMEEIQEYLLLRKLPAPLARRVERYYEYYLKKRSNFDEATILKELSSTLRNTVVREANSEIVSKISLFQQHSQLVTVIVPLLRPMFLVAGELLCTQNHVGKEMFFIFRGMLEGTVDKLLPDTHVPIALFTSGYYCGDVAVLLNQRQPVSVTAIVNCDLFSLTQDQLLDSLLLFADAAANIEQRAKNQLLGLHAALYSQWRAAQRQMLETLPMEDVPDPELEQPTLAAMSVAIHVLLNETLVPLSAIPKKLFVNESQQVLQLLTPALLSEVSPGSSWTGHWLAMRLPRTQHMVTEGALAKLEKATAFVEMTSIAEAQQESKGDREPPEPRSSVPQPEIRLTVPEDVLQVAHGFGRMEAALGSKERVPATIIVPTSTGKSCWDLFMTVLILYSAVTVPVNLAFDLGNTPLDFIDYAVDICFAIDILLSFRTAFVRSSDDHLVVEGDQIAWNYLRGWFCIDFVSTFPFDAVIGDGANGLVGLRLVRLLRLGRIAKMLRLLRLSDLYAKLEQKAGEGRAFLRAFRIVFQLAFIAHMAACAWYAISFIDDTDAWWKHIRFTPNNAADLYVASLYYSFTTLTTVGYGDITAITPAEKIFAIFLMMAGASTFGYIIGSMASLIGRFNGAEARISDRMDAIEAYMQDRHLSKPLREKVRQYYQFYLARKTAFNEAFILGELSDNLRTEVLLFLNKDVIAAIPFFKALTLQGEDTGCLAYVVSILNPTFAAPGDYIVKQGETGQEMYFLVKGRVQVSCRSGSQKATAVATLKEGAYFGEIAMLLDCKRSASVRALTVCNLFSLHRDDLNAMMLYYPALAVQMRDLIYQRMEELTEAGDSATAAPADVHASIQLEMQRVAALNRTVSKLKRSADVRTLIKRHNEVAHNATLGDLVDSVAADLAPQLPTHAATPGARLLEHDHSQHQLNLSDDDEDAKPAAPGDLASFSTRLLHMRPVQPPAGDDRAGT